MQRLPTAVIPFATAKADAASDRRPTAHEGGEPMAKIASRWRLVMQFASEATAFLLVGIKSRLLRSRSASSTRWRSVKSTNTPSIRGGCRFSTPAFRDTHRSTLSDPANETQFRRTSPSRKASVIFRATRPRSDGWTRFRNSSNECGSGCIGIAKDPLHLW